MIKQIIGFSKSSYYLDFFLVKSYIAFIAKATILKIILLEQISLKQLDNNLFQLISLAYSRK